jgi:nanoRNase/pAp phosphatase (c-di-AMP/oligoRNAs hydrolase)
VDRELRSGPAMSDPRDDGARRVHELRVFASGTRMVPILVQQDPDPDGMASALGIRTLLGRAPDDSPIVSLGEVTRPENLRMAELLGMRVTQVTEKELHGFARVIAVDTQPSPVESRTRYAVIDHHPRRDGYTADFVDIRPHVGAVATMVTEYLRVAGERITPRLATALLYGIRTDTDVLRRGTSRADVEAYAFLQELADGELLRKIARPSFPEDAIRALGLALTGLRREGDLAVAYVGRLDARTAHVLPNLADLCLSVEGVSWSAAAGLVGDELVVNLRRAGGGPGAGALARSMAQTEGQGGGHQSMARVALQVGSTDGLSDQPGDAASVGWLVDRIGQGLDRLRAVR